jgi:hypothetical protein
MNARYDAARNALNYLKIMTKKSSVADAANAKLSAAKK